MEIPDTLSMPEFGENGWEQLPDAISKRYKFIPAKVIVAEHQQKLHVGLSFRIYEF